MFCKLLNLNAAGVLGRNTSYVGASKNVHYFFHTPNQLLQIALQELVHYVRPMAVNGKTT